MSRIDDAEYQALRRAAERGRSMNWTPYTGAVVVAAVKTTAGGFYGGSNVEVANISLSKHAEEAAVIFALATEGTGGAPTDGGPQCIAAVYTTATPCGSCRQFLLEFATDDCVIYIEGSSSKPEAWLLHDLLPRAFGPAEQLAAGGQVRSSDG